jgi:hypothetical protein
MRDPSGPQREEAESYRRNRAASVAAAVPVIVAFAVVAFALTGLAAAQTGTAHASPRSAHDLSGGTVGAVSPAGSSVSARCLVGDNPEGVAYDPSDHDVYVADYAPGDGGISILKAPCTLITTIHLSSGTPYGAAYDPSTHDIMVSDPSMDAVYVLQGTSIVTILDGFCSPSSMTWDAPADALLVVDSWCGVDAIYGNTQTGVEVPAINDCSAAAALVADGYVWVADQCGTPYSVDVFDASTFASVGSFSISTVPGALAWDPVNDTVLVGSLYGNTMHVLEPATVALHTYVNSTFALGKLLGTTSILYSPTTHDMYVSGRAGSDIWTISSAGVSHSVAVGSGADLQFMSYDAATHHIYVTGWATNTVYVIG